MTREIIMLFVITICLLVLSSCKKDEKGSAASQPIDRGKAEHFPEEVEKRVSAYEDALKKAGTETERWRLVETLLADSYKPDWFVGSEVEFQVKHIVLGLSWHSELWFEYFPNIRRHVEFEVADINRLANFLGSNKSLVYSGARRNFGQLSQAWLHLFTGEKFKDKQAFDAWLEQNRDSLVWNQSEGRFEIRSAGDSGPKTP